MKIISYMLLMAMIYYSCTSVHMIRHNQSDYDEMNEDLDEKYQEWKKRQE